MKCKKCGFKSEIDFGSYCPHCGEPLANAVSSDAAGGRFFRNALFLILGVTLVVCAVHLVMNNPSKDDAYWEGDVDLVSLCADGGEGLQRLYDAAERGVAAAQCLLGNCYYEGIGVGRDEAETVKWYRKAAEQGHSDGQMNLGACYLFGSGVEEDKVEAAKWFRKSAEQSNADAQFLLGVCYYHGFGVEEDVDEAARWFHLAAEQGHEQAIAVEAEWFASDDDEDDESESDE